MNTDFTGSSSNLQISVPKGKRLIVESASVFIRLPAGQYARVVLLTNDVKGAGAGSLWFSLKHQGTFVARRNKR